MFNFVPRHIVFEGMSNLEFYCQKIECQRVILYLVLGNKKISLSKFLFFKKLQSFLSLYSSKIYYLRKIRYVDVSNASLRPIV